MNNKELQITEKQALSELEGRYSRAEEILKDINLTLDLVANAEKQAEEIIEKGKKIGDKIKTFINLVKDYAKKEYTQIPYKSIVAIVAAIIYFVNPGDIIPDVIPGFGHIDDFTVITLCYKIIDLDIKAYKEWKDIKEQEEN